MALLKVRKEVSVLPAILEADAVYAVRTGAGFNLYISDNTGAIAHLVNSVGGGGAAVIAQALVDLPFSKGGTTTMNVVSASVTPSSKIMACLVATGENEADDIDDWVVTATPQTGSIDFNIYCLGPFCGQVAINYMIG